MNIARIGWVKEALYIIKVYEYYKYFVFKNEKRDNTVFMYDEGISLIKCNDLRYKLCNLHTYYTIYLHYTVYIY